MNRSSWPSAIQAAAVILLISILTEPARAGFGLPEAEGLLRVRNTEAVGLGTLRTTFSHSYFYQDVGLGSRYHQFLGRLGFAFGLGEVGHLSFDTRLHGLLRFASTEDPLLYSAIGDSEWSAGLGDSDLGFKLILPLPVPRVHFGAELNLRLPTGDTDRGLSVETRDYEFMGIVSIDVLDGTRFVPTRLHLNAGQRMNRNPEGYGLPPTLDPNLGQSPFPPYYPALDEGDVIDSRRQNLFGAGLEFLGPDLSIYGELTLETFYQLTNRFATRENLWQLGLGFRVDGPWRLEFFGAFDINLSRDDFDTPFEPHFPGVLTSIGVNRSWQVLAGDPDGDGIRGDADLCPSRPEDRDGFEDEDGCPDADNDRDGVPDVIDLAPDLPEDFDGFEDEDGRPDLDNDNDGIGDRDDLCPDRAEDYDGVDDMDGCPDRLNSVPEEGAAPESEGKPADGQQP